MNAFDLLLDQWGRQVKELFPQFRHYQQQVLAFVVQAILLSGNAVLQRVAEVVWEYGSSETKIVSHERRLQRFVANEQIEDEVYWQHFLEQVFPFWHHKPVTLILDLTPYTQEATIVNVGIVMQSRVLPVPWCVMPQQEHWQEGPWPIVDRLFAEQVAPLLSSADCTLLTDRGLSCLRLITVCQQLGWHDVLRIKNEEWFRQAFRGGFRP